MIVLGDDDKSNYVRGEAEDALRYATAYHAPVLWHTVVRDLVTDRAGVYVDGTLGGGGHTAALLDVLGGDGLVIGIDRDEEALAEVRRRLGETVESGRLVLRQGSFGELDRIADEAGVESIDGLLLDLGVSSHQIDEASRGFSYMAGGSLDMRMNPSTGVTAASIVNEWSERELIGIIREFGEEPAARRIVRAILAARPIDKTDELARVVRSVVPEREEVKTLSRVFQALRIAVNEELSEIEKALLAAYGRVRIGGRVVVISYHSLEDRRVKRFFRSGNFRGEVERDVYGNRLVGWRELHRKPVRAGDDEVTLNPRSRSARLRSAERIDVPAQ